jgi:hypothetical protein
MVRDASGTGSNGASGRNDDEARWMVAQMAQKSFASFAGWCAGFCSDEGASDAAMAVTAEEPARPSRWMCPNESTSCSAIAASASQLPHRLFVRTQRIKRNVHDKRRSMYRWAARTQPHNRTEPWRQGNRPLSPVRSDVGRMLSDQSSFAVQRAGCIVTL